MGYNYRMTDLQGAIGEVQLRKLDILITQREKWALFYTNALKDIPWIKLPQFSSDFKHGWQSYVLLIDQERAQMSRNAIMDKLQQAGISSRPGTHAVHMLGYYAKKYNISPEDYPGAQIANDMSMAIPLHNRMVEKDFHYVINCIKSIN